MSELTILSLMRRRRASRYADIGAQAVMPTSTREPNELRTRIGAALRAARESYGLTTREAAQFCQLSHSYIVELESGRRNASIDSLVRVASVYGLTLDLVPDPDRRNQPALLRNRKPRR
jgi:ribosome-binding protein aMBF1 (putative translation factor)